MADRNALLSVSNKVGIVKFGRFLSDQGFTLYASGGTAKELHEAEVPVTNTAVIIVRAFLQQMTDILKDLGITFESSVLGEKVGGMGESMFGHRVVTLSRAIFAGILARATSDDRAMLKKMCIPWIDLICVVPYPIDIMCDLSTPLEEGVEAIDVGGPAMLAAAAKGMRIVVCHPEQYEIVARGIKSDAFEDTMIRRHFASMALASIGSDRLWAAHYLSNGIVIEPRWGDLFNVTGLLRDANEMIERREG